MTSKRNCTLLFLLLSLITATAKDIKTNIGAWQITYSTTTHAFNFKHKGCEVIQASCPEADYTLNGTKRRVKATDYVSAKVKKEDAVRRFVLLNNKDGVDMMLELTPCGDDLQTRLVLLSKTEISCNYLAPIKIVQPQPFKGEECRMLQVPYDNDGFVRYRYNKLDTKMLSHEVTTIFDGKSRNGIVIGSIDHDHWKSGIEVVASNGNSIDSLKTYSGVSNQDTHDLIPHGSLSGTRVESARFLLSVATDWRDGMEHFADVCASVSKPRQSTLTETPIGWQSWGVMAEHNNFDVDMNVADYYAKVLRPAGFADEDGLQIISIDSWDNLNNDQRLQLTAHCEAQGQLVGIYRTPFSLWWGNESDLKNPLYNGCKYSALDCVLKAKGKPIKYDGAFCLDPTHPAVKEMIKRNMEEARRQGFRYVKVDFTSNGMIQSDNYFNPKVHTAVEAYNEGMKYFASQCYDKDNKPMFITLSISPTFPYEHANARRIACDTWGKIGHSEYAMNAIAGSWWTNHFYQRNDPDHIVLVGNDNEKETEGENRARLTTGVVSGMVLLADNYDISDSVSHRGDAHLSRQRAEKVLMHKEVNSLARKVKTSFRPVYGYRPFDGKAESADNIVMKEIDGDTYVAVINYTNSPMTGSILLSDLGLNDNTYKVSELWTSETSSTQSTLNYMVPGKDARIFKIFVSY